MGVSITKDISGGGVCIIVPDEKEVGTTFYGSLELPSEKISFKGKVVRIQERENDGEINYEVGIQFIEIEDSDREIIIKYVMQEQMIERRNRLKRS